MQVVHDDGGSLLLKYQSLKCMLNLMVGCLLVLKYECKNDL
jgi:hypothetical protein